MKKIKVKQYLDLLSPTELKRNRDMILETRNQLVTGQLDLDNFNGLNDQIGHLLKNATIAARMFETLAGIEELSAKPKELETINVNA